MTEQSAPKSPMTAEEFSEIIRQELEYSQGVRPDQASPSDLYVASSLAVRRQLMDSWMSTQAEMINGSTKAVGYLSAEYLMGKQLHNALLSAGLTDQFNEVLKGWGWSVQDVIDAEVEPGLGNGGLGRLAACYIDSLASLNVPAFGYGIQYRYGIFKQEFDALGRQVEKPDYWQQNEEPWGHVDYNRFQKVDYGGEVIRENGHNIWKPAWSVKAVPVDYLVPGYASGRVNNLRLWSARSFDEFDLLTFNKSQYLDAVRPQVRAENISKILYPEDSTPQGKSLRLEQQYFFVSAALHDAIRVFYPGQDHPDLSSFPDKICFQLNDTHPVIAIPELMRILMDEHGYDWQAAWDITHRTFNYTCHTLLPEALETWPSQLLGKLLPRHLQIIEQIDRNFVSYLKTTVDDQKQIDRMRIISNTAKPEVRMAHLATVGGEKVNGVAELHSQLLRNVTLHDFSEVFPDKFTNVTNGVTPRRFIKLANPRLSDLITEGLGTDRWIANLDMLKELEPLAADDGFVQKFVDAKSQNKADFVAYAKRHYDFDINPDTMFDSMIKRLHEYKRQSLKILSVIATYADIKSGRHKAEDILPRTVFFGAKAAPGYRMAKLTIELINNVARVVNRDPEVKGKLAVFFPWNYNVRLAQHLIPATELDEQISQAGKEASGTGNMKFALNGSLTVGTLDGANVEIRDRVGADSFFLFGMTVDQVDDLFAKGYDPSEYYRADSRLSKAIDMVADGTFSDGDEGAYSLLVEDWLHKDNFMTLADFSSYEAIQTSIDKLYRNPLEWGRKALINVANSGYFSSDRAVNDYLKAIWKTGPAD